MNKAWTRTLALMLVISLSLTVPTMPVAGTARAEAPQDAASGPQAPGESEEPGAEPEKPPRAPAEAPGGEPPAAPSEPTKAPEAAEPSGEPTAAPSGEPTAAPSGEPTAAPSGEPTEAPSGEPTAAPSGEPTEAPSEEPTAAPSEEPAEAPTEAPGETAAPAAYAVSPAEAAFELGGGQPALEFAVSPADAPFEGIEGVESAFEGGVVTVPAEALEALGPGEHILAFLFSDGARVEVKLTLAQAAPRLVAKGDLTRLKIDGRDLTAGELSGGASGSNWSWDAAAGVLTLSGYNGGTISAGGILRVHLAEGTANSVTSTQDGDAIFSDNQLILSGSGSLTATASGFAAVGARDKLTIESGTITANGAKHGFASSRSIIVINGGTLEAKGQSGTGAGFYVDNTDYYSPRWVAVNGGNVSVDGFSAGISALHLSAGSVTIKNCGWGIVNDLSALGGALTIRNVTRNAVTQAGGSMKISGCTVDISECGEIGIAGDSYVSVVKGARVSVQAKGFAISAGEIAIDRTAAVDLYGIPQAVYARKITIGSSRYSGKYIHVVVEGGRVRAQEDALLELTIGGSKYDAFALTKDLAGPGWAWTAKDRTIALDGYDGGEVAALGKAIRLTLSGANKVAGAVSAQGLTVSGAGALVATKISSGSGDLVLQSGQIGAQIAVARGFTLSGGSFEVLKRVADGSYESAGIACTAFKMTGGLLVVDEDGPSSDPLYASGTISVSGGTISMTGIAGNNLFATGDVRISGGTIKLTEPPMSYGGNGIASGGNIIVTGGNIEIDKGGQALSAEYRTISISGRPNLNLKSYTDSAFFAKTVKIGGKVYARRYSIAVIARGKLVDEDKLAPDLEIGGQKFFMKELNAGDCAGDGWSWSARKNTLTLNGYGGGFILTDRIMTIWLSAGTSNSAAAGESYSGASLFAQKSLTLAGTGRWSGGIYAGSNLKISGSRGVTADFIKADHWNLTIENARVRVNGNIDANNLSISGGDVQAKKVDTGNLTLKKSALEATAGAYEYDPAIDCYGSLSASDSLILCENLNVNGKVRLSGTPVFLWYALQEGEIPGLPGGTVIRVLYNRSVTLSRDMALPGLHHYVIPYGCTMKVARGRKLYVYGALWGAVSGKVVGRSHSGRIEITGSPEVARGRSVALAAKVLPAFAGVDVSQAVAWASDNPGRVAVSDKGVVTAAASATVGDAAVITCTALDDSGISQAFTVTVTEPSKKITIRDGGGAAVTKLTAPRSAGSVALSASVDPSGASALVRWASSNRSVASVDPVTGVVTPLRRGTASITCAAQDGTGVRAALRLTVQ